MSSENDNMTDLNVDPKILNPEGSGELENGSSASAHGHHDIAVSSLSLEVVGSYVSLIKSR